MKPNYQLPPSSTAASDKWSKIGKAIEEKISRLDVEVFKYKEQIHRMRPGPALEVVKGRMRRKLKQKRAYELQRDILSSRNFGENQVSSAKERIKDSKQKKKSQRKMKEPSRSLLCVLLPRCCIVS